jgi:hypothetical protein
LAVSRNNSQNEVTYRSGVRKVGFEINLERYRWSLMLGCKYKYYAEDTTL